MDIRTDALLAAARDALAVPYPATPDARLAYLELHRDRSTAVRHALDQAAAGDVDGALDMIEQAVAAMPVTYPVDQMWTVIA